MPSTTPRSLHAKPLLQSLVQSQPLSTRAIRTCRPPTRILQPLGQHRSPPPPRATRPPPPTPAISRNSSSSTPRTAAPTPAPPSPTTSSKRRSPSPSPRASAPLSPPAASPSSPPATPIPPMPSPPTSAPDRQPRPCPRLHPAPRHRHRLRRPHLHLLAAEPTSPRPPPPSPWKTAQAAYLPQSLRLANQLGPALAKANIPTILSRAAVPPLDNLICPAVAIEIAPHPDYARSPTPPTSNRHRQRRLSPAAHPQPPAAQTSATAPDPTPAADPK